MQILSVSMQTLSQQVSLLLGALRACSKRGACQMFGCISSPAMSCVNAPGGQWGVNGGGDKVKGVCRACTQNDTRAAPEHAHNDHLLDTL